MTNGAMIEELPSASSQSGRVAGGEAPAPCYRIALLTPYTGGNLGDAAIQDAMIANLRLRLPGAQFSGISLNCDNFLEQHGAGAFPLCASSRGFYGMCIGPVAGQPGFVESSPERLEHQRKEEGKLKKTLKRIPLLGWFLKTVYACWREFRHCLRGYRFLRAHDLVIVSGGGQLNEEWGGPWSHPFSLFKWAVLARIAGVPYVVASVGVGKVRSKTSRLFLRSALRMAQYRSYRDKNSKGFAATLLQRASDDSVVPDLAFSLPPSEISPSAGIPARAKGRPTIAISPIIYANPRFWPYQDRALYDRYVGQLARLVAQLLARDYFLVIVCSSLGDDETAIPELLGRLDDQSKKRLAEQLYIPPTPTWRDLVATFREVDFLIVSRLHSAILGFVADKPTVAISFDPKVDWAMEDLGQTDYLLHIRDFTAEAVIAALDQAKMRGDFIVEQMRSYRREALSASAKQYDALARLASAGRGARH